MMFTKLLRLTLVEKEMTAKDYLNGKNKENLVGEILC